MASLDEVLQQVDAKLQHLESALQSGTPSKAGAEEDVESTSVLLSLLRRAAAGASASRIDSLPLAESDRQEWLGGASAGSTAAHVLSGLLKKKESLLRDIGVMQSHARDGKLGMGMPHLGEEPEAAQAESRGEDSDEDNLDTFVVGEGIEEEQEKAMTTRMMNSTEWD